MWLLMAGDSRRVPPWTSSGKRMQSGWTGGSAPVQLAARAQMTALNGHGSARIIPVTSSSAPEAGGKDRDSAAGFQAVSAGTRGRLLRSPVGGKRVRRGRPRSAREREGETRFGAAGARSTARRNEASAAALPCARRRAQLDRCPDRRRQCARPPRWTMGSRAAARMSRPPNHMRLAGPAPSRCTIVRAIASSNR